MTDTATEIDWKALVGHKVKLTVQNDSNPEPTEVNGWLESEGKNGILVKRKRNTASSADLFLKFEIVSVELDEEVEALKQVDLKPVTEKNVRRHLLNYHGEDLSTVNRLSNDAALSYHQGLHDGERAFEIGHLHTDADKKADEHRRLNGGGATLHEGSRCV